MKPKYPLYIIVVASVLLLFAVSAQAYVIPEEYRASEHMNDVQVYQVSIAHLDTPWGYDNLRQLAIGYTNNGNLGQLVTKMNWYISETM